MVILSENAEYHSAKDKQGMIEARIKELGAVLGAAQVIDPVALGADGRCIFGAFVRLEAADGMSLTYRIVGEYEANVEDGLLSSHLAYWPRFAGANTLATVWLWTPPEAPANTALLRFLTNEHFIALAGADVACPPQCIVGG